VNPPADRISQGGTHRVLAEGEGHAIGISTNFDKHGPILAKLASHSRLEGTIVSGLRQAEEGQQKADGQGWEHID